MKNSIAIGMVSKVVLLGLMVILPCNKSHARFLPTDIGGGGGGGGGNAGDTPTPTPTATATATSTPEIFPTPLPTVVPTEPPVGEMTPAPTIKPTSIPTTDSCLEDSSKLSPGACGCGVPDDDNNVNYVADCLINPDLRASIGLAQKNLAKIKVRKGASRPQRKELLGRMRIITETVKLVGPSIVLSSAKVKLPKLTKRAAKAVKSSARLKGDALKDAKKNARRALGRLLRGVANS